MRLALGTPTAEKILWRWAIADPEDQSWVLPMLLLPPVINWLFRTFGDRSLGRTDSGRADLRIGPCSHAIGYLGLSQATCVNGPAQLGLMSGNRGLWSPDDVPGPLAMSTRWQPDDEVSFGVAGPAWRVRNPGA